MASTTAIVEPLGVAFRAAPEWVVFACDDHRYGIRLGRVREILMPQEFTRLPGCGPEVCGLVGLRGRVVTVFDLGAALGKRPAAATADHRLLLIDCGERLVAGVVDEVVAVASGSEESESQTDDGWRVIPWRIGRHRPSETRTGRAFLAPDLDELLSRLLA